MLLLVAPTTYMDELRDDGRAMVPTHLEKGSILVVVTHL